MAKKKETPTVEEVTIDEKKAQNESLIEQLTNKNTSYIVKLNRQLKNRGWDDDQVTEVLYSMLPTIVEQQANHITAKKLYGTVTEQADHLTAGPNRKNNVVEKSEPWKLYIDGALLLGGLLAVINGVFQLFGNGQTQNPMGAATLFINFLLAGGAMLVIGKYAPEPGKKGGFMKYILASTLTMLVWMLFFSVGAALIPRVINPVVPPMVSIGIGVLAIIGKYFFKRAFDVHGSLI